MSLYIGMGDAAKGLQKIYLGSGDTAKSLQKIYLGLDDTAKSVYSVYKGGAPISSLGVGNVVKIKVDGTAKEFIVVQQGNPDTSVYDDSCNGTWLLMQDIYVNRTWDDYGELYKESTINTYLNGDFLGLIDSSVRSAIKQVKIPYKTGASNSDIDTGANGLSTKVFLLSNYEVGQTSGAYGTCLKYFSGSSGSSNDSNRIANYDGHAQVWWLRFTTTYTVYIVTVYGGISTASCFTTYGVRPAMILPSDTLVDGDGNVIG